MGIYEDSLITNMTNGSLIEYLESDKFDLNASFSVIYSIIFVAGVVGNTSTCIVIARNRSMHTATNFYLFSLAISDMLLLICGLPLEVYRLWYPYTYPLGEAMCITIGLVCETTANATVLTITAFTVERYIAICRPFMSHTMSKLSRAVRFIVGVWVMALCLAVPQAIQFGIVSEDNQNSSSCTVKGQGVHQVFVISSFVFFVVPMTVITVLYALIGYKLRTSSVLHPTKKLSVESGNERPLNSYAQYRHGASQRRVIRMLGELTSHQVFKTLSIYFKEIKFLLLTDYFS